MEACSCVLVRGIVYGRSIVFVSVMVCVCVCECVCVYVCVRERVCVRDDGTGRIPACSSSSVLLNPMYTNGTTSTAPTTSDGFYSFELASRTCVWFVFAVVGVEGGGINRAEFIPGVAVTDTYRSEPKQQRRRQRRPKQNPSKNRKKCNDGQ